MNEEKTKEQKVKEEKSFMQNAVNLGFGLVSVTREKIEKLSTDLVKRGELTSKEAKNWVQEFEKSLSKERQYLDKKVSQAVKDFIQKFKIPSRSEFDRLSKEVSKLRKEVTSLKKAKTTTRKRTRRRTTKKDGSKKT